MRGGRDRRRCETVSSETHALFESREAHRRNRKTSMVVSGTDSKVLVNGVLTINADAPQSLSTRSAGRGRSDCRG